MRNKYFYATIALIVLNACNNNTAVDGVYVGLEEMQSITPDDSLRKWYHQNDLFIEGDSAFMSQGPISVYKNDTDRSASDGGFYYYKGTIALNGDSLTINLLQTGCDYCADPVKVNKNGSFTKLAVTKKLVGKFNDSSITLNNLQYLKDEKRIGMFYGNKPQR